jgi:predicted permease
MSGHTEEASSQVSAVEIDGAVDPGTATRARSLTVSPGFFELFRSSVVTGRDFDRRDREGGLRVAIVNETFAKKFGLGRDAVGKLMGDGGNDSLNITIVGLVQDAKYSQVRDTTPPQFFRPYRQADRVNGMTYYVRTATAPEQVLRAIPGLVRKLDPDLPVEDLKTLPQQVRENVFFDRMISILSASFAVLATLLAAVGLYGVLAYTVAQRTREIGVRMGLGADEGRVRSMVLRQLSGMLLVGGAIGVAAALGLGKAARSLLYGLQGHDPVVFVLSVVLLGLVAVSAGWLPARRAAQVHPMQALRYD